MVVLQKGVVEFLDFSEEVVGGERGREGGEGGGGSGGEGGGGVEGRGGERGREGGGGEGFDLLGDEVVHGQALINVIR